MDVEAEDVVWRADVRAVVIEVVSVAVVRVARCVAARALIPRRCRADAPAGVWCSTVTSTVSNDTVSCLTRLSVTAARCVMWVVAVESAAVTAVSAVCRCTRQPHRAMPGSMHRPMVACMRCRRLLREGVFMVL